MICNSWELVDQIAQFKKIYCSCWKTPTHFQGKHKRNWQQNEIASKFDISAHNLSEVSSQLEKLAVHSSGNSGKHNTVRYIQNCWRIRCVGRCPVHSPRWCRCCDGRQRWDNLTYITPRRDIPRTQGLQSWRLHFGSNHQNLHEGTLNSKNRDTNPSV